MSGFVIWTISFGKLAVGWSFRISFWFHGRGTSADLSASVSSGTSLGACDPSMSSWLAEYQHEANGLYINLNLEHFWWYFANLISMEEDLVIFNMITMKKDLTIFGAEYYPWLQSSSHLSLRLLLFFLFVFGGVGRLNIAKGSANPRVTPFKSPKHYWVS